MRKRLVVVGNGFDIAHGLPTSYKHFVKQLKQEQQGFFDIICRYIPEDALWASFEQALSQIDVDQLHDNNSCYLLGYGDENWKDSAHHDYQYMIGEDLSFAEDIPKYFFEWISKIDTHVLPKFDCDIVDKENIYLSFNYTNTLENVYNIPAKNILYIHGKAMQNDELIIGHHSDDLLQYESEPEFSSEEEKQIYYDNYNEDVRISEANGIIRTYFRTTYKDTASIIQKNRDFFDMLSNINEVYIYGHSMSLIDFDYFSEIYNSVSNACKWHIFYHSSEDYANAMYLVNVLNISLYQLYEV